MSRIFNRRRRTHFPVVSGASAIRKANHAATNFRDVLGVLNIVFGALGLIGMLFTIVTFFLPAGSTNNPVIEIIRNSPDYAA